MMNKKAFEMSIGMIVIIILSVLIFSMSLYFVFKWFGSAEDLKAEIDKQTQEQIVAALQSGNQLVAIPIAIQEAKRGTSANFGVGIRNIGVEKDFSLALSFSGAYLPDGKLIDCDPEYMERNWLGSFSVSKLGKLKKNEQKVFPFMVKADLNVASGKPAPKGDYVFNVCVYDSQITSNNCNIGQFQVSSDAFYTSKIYQVTVKVV
ncbi:MAG: hypothetical protein NTW67_01250 [Candidatus Woesearchaeota archaeon]|nr:hypothetical protein [Candidatus Woesearchaeota archaeon]